MEAVSVDSLGQVLEMSTITHLPLGSRPPQILRGQDFTVIIVESKGAKATAMRGRRAVEPLALADLIGLLVAKDDADDK